MQTVIAGLSFEWDDEKAKENRKKHKVSFEIAAKVFSDPDYVEYPDEVHSSGEVRYKVVGMSEKLLLVICTDREDTIRIISARKANAKERRIYNDYRAKIYPF